MATVSVSNSLFVNNTAVNFNGFGGGINQAGGTLTITNSQFTANVASFLGGGVFFNGVQLVITASTFDLNNAVNGGGGVFFAGSGTDRDRQAPRR